MVIFEFESCAVGIHISKALPMMAVLLGHPAVKKLAIKHRDQVMTMATSAGRNTRFA